MKKAKQMMKPESHKDAKSQWIYGRHAVAAALQAGRREVFEIWAAQPLTGELGKLTSGRKVKQVTKAELDQRFPESVHQGVTARVGPLAPMAVEDLLDCKLVLMLDQVTDPHNLGAILRSADAFGCGGVIVPSARSAPLTEVVAKTACGALETVPVVEANLAQSIQKLQQAGFWVVGLDGSADMVLGDVPRSDRMCLVLGSEGSGLRELVAKNCDYLAKLPMVGTVESLNVSVAAAVALYEVAFVNTTA